MIQRGSPRFKDPTILFKGRSCGFKEVKVGGRPQRPFAIDHFLWNPKMHDGLVVKTTSLARDDPSQQRNFRLRL